MRILPSVAAALTACICLTGTAAYAEAPAAFVKLRDRAQPVESLTAFLDRYVGGCGMFADKACEAKAKAARDQMTGKSYHLILDSSATRMLQPGGFNPSTRQFRFDLTPFFDANGVALTHGAPQSQDAQGRPRISLMPLFAELPPGTMPMDMERLLRTQNIKIHLVFKPAGMWTLPAKGSKSKSKIQGVKAKFLAVRLTDARTGEEIALKIP